MLSLYCYYFYMPLVTLPYWVVKARLKRDLHQLTFTSCYLSKPVKSLKTLLLELPIEMVLSDSPKL